MWIRFTEVPSSPLDVSGGAIQENFALDARIDGRDEGFVLRGGAGGEDAQLLVALRGVGIDDGAA